jgi:dihydroneopterin aldolase
MDKIIISDLEVFCRVGVPDEERSQPQRLLLAVELAKDLRNAAATDDLADTINYFAVTRRLLRFGDGRSWKLIEKLAADLAEMILNDFGPDAVSVEVKKFILPEARYVSVRIERRAQ